jgi:hypothetical protein
MYNHAQEICLHGILVGMSSGRKYKTAYSGWAPLCGSSSCRTHFLARYFFWLRCSCLRALPSYPKVYPPPLFSLKNGGDRRYGLLCILWLPSELTLWICFTHLINLPNFQGMSLECICMYLFIITSVTVPSVVLTIAKGCYIDIR